MPTLNLGILAHVDAGKTSLTERLLHAAGVVETVGRVDDGSTRTDFLALERQRGITIRSAVVSFRLADDLTVNLIDTPGHPDFIAEVERVLHVLDGAVLVVSAVEGVQAQTRVLMRTLRRLRLPTLLFVNKTDRRGASPDGTLDGIARRLVRTAVPMGAVPSAGSADAGFLPYGPSDAAFGERLADVLTRHDETLLAEYVAADGRLPHDRLRGALADQTGRALVHPVFFGSAVTGAGVGALTEGVRTLLPAARGEAEGPVSGSVFKVGRGPGGERLAYVRMAAGTLRVRDRVPFGAAADGTEELPEGKVTGVEVFEEGEAVPRDAVAAGHIGRVRGLEGVRIGDALGVPPPGTAERHFAPPTLETVVAPVRPGDRRALHVALTQLAEQDPLIGLRHDPRTGQTHVSLYGEVQKEVLEATLADEHGIAVTFRRTTTLCVERVAGCGAAHEIIDTGPNPFLATVGLRVEPAPVGAGVRFRLGVELGSMPYAFFAAVEETVRETLGQGLYGWRVPDCTVTMTHSGYWPRQSHAHAVFDKSMSSTAGDFRNLTPLVLMDALRRAGTRVCEPVHGFRLEAPADTAGAVLSLLARLGGVPRSTRTGDGTAVLEGDVPAARVDTLQRRLPTLSRGEGVLESSFARYEPVRGAPPARPRTDHDPLDRKQYLLRVVRRTGTGTAGAHGPGPGSTAGHGG